MTDDSNKATKRRLRTTKEWVERHAICADDHELAGYEERILLAIRELGYLSFKEFLGAHSIDEETGEPWSLTEHAEALNVPQTPYIRYHTRWVEVNAPRGALP